MTSLSEISFVGPLHNQIMQALTQLGDFPNLSNIEIYSTAKQYFENYYLENNLGDAQIFPWEPLVNKNGKLTPAIQRIDEQGITSIHEIGGHAYYFQQGVKGWDNDSETSSFEGRVRQFYRGKYLKNYIKRQPVIQHHYF